MRNDIRVYRGIDVGKLLFACLIPILHIPFSVSTDGIIFLIQQYISRLGVPFFYATSGLLLSNNLNNWKNVRKYLMRIGFLLVFWVLIYMPIFIHQYGVGVVFFQQILCKTPGYLWYLTGLLVATILMSVVPRKYHVCLAAILYIVGILLSESYSWIIGGRNIYHTLFLTSRNGLFFGFPFMIIGEIAVDRNIKMWLGGGTLLLVSIIYTAEVTFIGNRVGTNNDRSFYVVMPLVVYYILLFLKQWNPNIETVHMRKISTAIYVMQFGMITMCSAAFNRLGFDYPDIANYLITYVVVIVLPALIYIALRKYRVTKYIF